MAADPISPCSPQVIVPHPTSLAGSFFTKIIRMESATVKLEIWDTAGQEKYHSVCHLYYRGAHAALLVYDITNKVRGDAEPLGTKMLPRDTSLVGQKAPGAMVSLSLPRKRLAGRSCG